MKRSIFNDYSPLKPYFCDESLEQIRNSEQSFFEALKLFNADYALNSLKSFDSSYFEEISSEIHHQLETEIKENIVAYQKFLTGTDKFIDKDNYLKKYPLNELLPDFFYKYMKMISVSSGSSGKPYFWPRSNYLELETTILYELILKDFFEADSKSTLIIDAYSMGMYVAGVFTLNACLRMSLRGYNTSVITPGISIDSILRIITDLGRNYEQIIICGYPPFVKDTIEEGSRRGINWSDYKLRFIFGAEAISEEWRSYLYKEASITDYYRSSINTYGSADAGILGHETPLSIFIKKICSEKPELLNKLFNGRNVSTFVQYHPNLKHFESIDDELICSTVGGMPLLKYNLHDAGSVYTFNQMIELFNNEGIDILAAAKEQNLPIWNLPFIVLYGKSDQTVTIYGLNVYPQTVRNALEDPELIDQVTTRMTMFTKYDEKEDQFIEVEVELKNESEPSPELESKVEGIVYENLLKHNYEYKTLIEKIGEKARPKIVLKPFGSITNDRGSKQAWILRNPE